MARLPDIFGLCKIVYKNGSTPKKLVKIRLRRRIYRIRTNGIYNKDETKTEPRPMPYGIAKALRSLPSGALSSLAMIAISKIYAREDRAPLGSDLSAFA